MHACPDRDTSEKQKKICGGDGEEKEKEKEGGDKRKLTYHKTKCQNLNSIVTE